MQTKNSRCLELKSLFIFLALFLPFSFSAWAAPQKNVSETPEERAKVDQALASQERGKPMPGKVIKKKPEVNSQKTLTKKLVTHPSKNFHKLEEKKPEMIKKPLVPHPKRSLTSKKPLVGNKKLEGRKSRFKPDSINQPLKTEK